MAERMHCNENFFYFFQQRVLLFNYLWHTYVDRKRGFQIANMIVKGQGQICLLLVTVTPITSLTVAVHIWHNDD